MRKLLTLVLTSLVLTGCSSANVQETTIVEEDGNKCETLNVFNWGEYVGEDTLSNFEATYGVKINYSLFESNEQMYTRMQSGIKFDVMIPSDYMIQRLISEDLIQPINKEIVNNLDLLNPATLDQSYDPGNVYSVPYFYGTMGIIYNSTTVDPKIIETEGYEVYRDPQFENRVFAYDSERDEFMVALKALGYSMNTTDLDELKAAFEWLEDSDNTTNPAYVTDEVIDAMINEEKDIAFVWSGDATYIASENPNMVYYAPEQSGTKLWTDAMVIPNNAKCPNLANEFIKYMTTDEVSLNNSEYVGYTSPNITAFDELSQNTFQGLSSYVVRTGNPKDEYLVFDKDQAKIIADYWIKVKDN